jgi:hypothetical protein
MRITTPLASAHPAGLPGVHRLSLAALAVASALAGAPVLAQTTDAHAAGRILLMPRAGLSDAALGRILQAEGAGKARRIGKSELRVVELPAGRERALVQRLARHPHVKFAELDRIVTHDLAANDPFLGSQWHLPKIVADGAWSDTTGEGVIVAVLDSGIDTAHPDFAGKLTAGYNFSGGNTDVSDVKDHGTKVAGSAAAAVNNGVGVAGVAGGARIMPIRVSDSTGTAYWSSIASGLTWAADRGARVANVSFNGAAGSSSVLSAARYMKSKGGLVFVSAGNNNTDPNYANTDDVIIVAATNKSDAKASFSNFGDHVHLSAPGEAIYTTTWKQGYASVSGTSFAAPIAAGTAALVMAANPGLTNTQVQQILFSTAVDLGAAGRDITFGHGRVDAQAAVAAALATLPPAVDSQAPTAAIQAPLGSTTVSGLVPVDVSAADNVGVAKVELLVNGKVVATDTAAPFAFSWDSAQVPNGMASLVARAHDAAGNVGPSATVSVNVANATAIDATAPTITALTPADGSTVAAGSVSVSGSASDNAGLPGLVLTLSIDGRAVASSTGTGTLKYNWNTRKLKRGSHTLTLQARDAAGNVSIRSATVTR